MAKDLTTAAIAHSVPEIQQALAHLWERRIAPVDADGGHVVAARSRLLNLVVVAGHRETAERCAAIIAATAGRHPSRSLILSALDVEGPPGLSARVEAVEAAASAGAAQTGAETIYVATHGETRHHLASIIVPLLLRDLPVALWWPHDPQFDSRRADRLLPMVDRLIVDGSSWSGDGLGRLCAMARVTHREGLVVADFALLRQARWREALASVYDLPDLRPHLRAVRSIVVEYAASAQGDPGGLTNVVRPVYHVAWLASRLGMGVVEPMRRVADGTRMATLRQSEHQVAVEWRPVLSELGPGSTVRVEIVSRLRGAELVGNVAAGDRTVEVTIRDDGRKRVRRTYLAPRLQEVDLLERAIEDSAADPVAGDALALAWRLIGAEPVVPAAGDAAASPARDDDE